MAQPPSGRRPRKPGRTREHLRRPDTASEPTPDRHRDRARRRAQQQAASRAAAKQRRALTTTRAVGRSEHGGDPELARQLARALTAPRAADEVARQLTHAIHPYPARMHPATARALTQIVLARRAAPAMPTRSGAVAARTDAVTSAASDAGRSPETDAPMAADEAPVVLDPFCGSGTVLVEARRAGARAIGVDINPLAVLIARAVTWAAPTSRRKLLRRLGSEIAADAVAAGKAARRAEGRQAPHRIPVGVNASERDARIRDWFAPHVRRELEHLAARIDAVREHDAEMADVLTVALSAVLYQVSRRASDTDATRIDRRVARGAAARAFERRVSALADGLAALARGRGPVADVRCADARQLASAGLGDASVDAVITSPPYAGTYDYADHHGLRMDFLGISTAELDAGELGARREFGGDTRARRRARRAWARNLAQSLGEVARVLRPGGLAAIAIGDSVAGGRAMWADEAIDAARGESLVIKAWAWQSRPKLGGLERVAFADRDKREFVFLLERV